MSGHVCTIQLRVRYSETDQMGTFYNSRALEWFECGRSELFREIGLPYTELEKRDVMLPIVESHVHYLGRARYDDLLQITTTVAFAGKARLRFDVRIVHAARPAGVVEGYTIHAVTNSTGKPIRPPTWLIDALQQDGNK